MDFEEFKETETYRAMVAEITRPIDLESIRETGFRLGQKWAKKQEEAILKAIANDQHGL
jgi:hypothetical protein